jgi:hypothetical protein
LIYAPRRFFGHLRNLVIVDFSEAAANSNLLVKFVYFIYELQPVAV